MHTLSLVCARVSVEYKKKKKKKERERKEKRQRERERKVKRESNERMGSSVAQFTALPCVFSLPNETVVILWLACALERYIPPLEWKGSVG